MEKLLQLFSHRSTLITADFFLLLSYTNLPVRWRRQVSWILVSVKIQ